MTTAEYMERLRAELAAKPWMTERSPRTRPSDAQCRADLAADIPESDDLRAMGEHQDAESERDLMLEDDVPLNYDPKRWKAGL